MEEPREDRAVFTEQRKYAKMLERVKEVVCEGVADSDDHYVICVAGARDTSNLFKLVNSGNDIVDKCIVAFATLNTEVEYLKDEAKDFYSALLLYGEDVRTIEQHASNVQMMARFLPFLQRLSFFINRIYEVCRNLVLQLLNFYRISEDVLAKARTRSFLSVWNALGDALSILVVIDEIVSSHPNLLDHWNAYVKSIQMIHHNPNQFISDLERLKPFQSLVSNLDVQIMSTNVFNNCCMQTFEQDLSTNEIFFDRFYKSLSEIFEQWDKSSTVVAGRQSLMRICCLASLYQNIKGTIDKKLMKSLWGTYRKLPSFTIVGDIVWCPCEFLSKSVPGGQSFIDKKSMASLTALRQSVFNHQLESLIGDAEVLEAEVNDWRIEMNERCFENSTKELDASTSLTQQFETIVKGSLLSDRMMRVLKCILNGQASSATALSKSNASAIFRIIELIKIVESIFLDHWSSILELSQQVCQMWSGDVLRIVEAVKSSLTSSGSIVEQIRSATTNLNTKNIDAISSLVVVQQVLSGNISRNRLITATVALEMANYMKLFKWGDIQYVNDCLRRVETAHKFGYLFSQVSTCAILYWHRSLCKVYFDAMLSDPDGNPLSKNSAYFFRAIDDACAVLKYAAHCQPGEIIASFRKEIFSAYEQSHLSKLCHLIENDLRLSIHSHLQLDDRTPCNPIASRSSGLHELLRTSKIRIGNDVLDGTRFVEKYLEKTFYNLSAVALYDCHTYSRMRLLAYDKYGLILCDSRLPFLRIDQGLDIIFVMRNLQMFVANYNYNLNEQVFFERDSNSRYLNVLGVEHVSNSIRTHGLGIMNTTVNFTYQFLKKRFFAFSQFLYDDHIKSQLSKDLRFYRENTESLAKMYPVKRAERFNSEIRKLGVSADDESFLDRFRVLVTQIGNALGYVRLLRSGAIEASEYAACLLLDADSDEPLKLSSLVEEAGGSQTTCDAADMFDGLSESITKYFLNNNDYMQLLVEVFSSEFRNYDKFDHLRNFFMIVPPLTVNFIEHILSCKGRLGKRGASGKNFTFTDDGFCMGIAYILILLDQFDHFTSLNWFESVLKKCNEEREKVEKAHREAVKDKTNESYSHSLALKLTRLDSYQQEFKLLMYTLHSARIFLHVESNDSSWEDF